MSGPAINRGWLPVDRLDDAATQAVAVTAIGALSRRQLSEAIAACERCALKPALDSATWQLAADAFRHERRRRYNR